MGVLQIYGIEQLVDIRTITRSRHNPQFNNSTLAESLSTQHLEYAHIQALGGLRRARKDSPTPAGEMRAFAATPIICKPRSFRMRLKDSFT